MIYERNCACCGECGGVPPPRTACVCGSTDFSVSEILWHRAKIDNGQLVLVTIDDECGGFNSAKCARCSKHYPLDAFDADNLTKNL